MNILYRLDSASLFPDQYNLHYLINAFYASTVFWCGGHRMCLKMNIELVVIIVSFFVTAS